MSINQLLTILEHTAVSENGVVIPKMVLQLNRETYVLRDFWGPKFQSISRSFHRSVVCVFHANADPRLSRPIVKLEQHSSGAT